MKPQDTQAALIPFGVELETTIPMTSGVAIGGYHHGAPVISGQTPNGTIAAPTFQGAPWRAERDGSIETQRNTLACEFVSPVLSGADGVQALGAFMEWMRSIGAEVNSSCGCHITVSVDHIIGSSDPQARAEFARKLAHISRWHARAIYGQTGTGRHLNRYSHTFDESVGTKMRQMLSGDSIRKSQLAQECGRGMVNFRKLMSHGVVEFRAFAGTTNFDKVQHHLGTVLGLCRRAHEVQVLGGFKKNKAQAARTATAADALRFLWDYLGWTGTKRPVALGLFGALHENFSNYRTVALELCNKFDARYPDANL